MQKYIGGTGVKAWVERIVSAGRHVRKTGESKGFTVKGNISGSRPGINTGGSEGPGLPAHEISHVNEQTRPPQVSQVQMVNRKVEPESARSVPSDTDADRSLITSVHSLPVPEGRQESKIQTSSNEQVTGRASPDSRADTQPEVDLKEVADKVYRLMQHDLIVERERATKIGG